MDVMMVYWGWRANEVDAGGGSLRAWEHGEYGARAPVVGWKHCDGLGRVPGTHWVVGRVAALGPLWPCCGLTTPADLGVCVLHAPGTAALAESCHVCFPLFFFFPSLVLLSGLGPIVV